MNTTTVPLSEADTLGAIAIIGAALGLIIALLLWVVFRQRRQYRNQLEHQWDITLADEMGKLAQEREADNGDLRDQMARLKSYTSQKEAEVSTLKTEKGNLVRQLNGLVETAGQREAGMKAELTATTRWISKSYDLAVAMTEDLSNRYKGANEQKKPQAALDLLDHLFTVPGYLPQTVEETAARVQAEHGKLPPPPVHRDGRKHVKGLPVKQVVQFDDLPPHLQDQVRDHFGHDQ